MEGSSHPELLDTMFIQQIVYSVPFDGRNSQFKLLFVNIMNLGMLQDIFKYFIAQENSG